jgi:hypothetical protein
MAPIVALADALEHVGVEADQEPEATLVEGLLNAISDEVRKLSRRGLEGESTEYDQVLRIRRLLEFTLPEAPIDPDEGVVLTPVLFDGTELDPLEAATYRIEDAARGRIRITTRTEYVRAVWTATGEIPDSIAQAVLDWLKDRFDARDRARDLASYQTGDDAEAYFATLAGKAPSSVGRALGLAWQGQAEVI